MTRNGAYFLLNGGIAGAIAAVVLHKLPVKTHYVDGVPVTSVNPLSWWQMLLAGAAVGLGYGLVFQVITVLRTNVQQRAKS